MRMIAFTQAGEQLQTQGVNGIPLGLKDAQNTDEAFSHVPENFT